MQWSPGSAKTSLPCTHRTRQVLHSAWRAGAPLAETLPCEKNEHTCWPHLDRNVEVNQGRRLSLACKVCLWGWCGPTCDKNDSVRHFFLRPREGGVVTVTSRNTCYARVTRGHTCYARVTQGCVLHNLHIRSPTFTHAPTIQQQGSRRPAPAWVLVSPGAPWWGAATYR